MNTVQYLKVHLRLASEQIRTALSTTVLSPPLTDDSSNPTNFLLSFRLFRNMSILQTVQKTLPYKIS